MIPTYLSRPSRGRSEHSGAPRADTPLAPRAGTSSRGLLTLIAISLIAALDARAEAQLVDAPCVNAPCVNAPCVNAPCVNAPWVEAALVDSRDPQVVVVSPSPGSPVVPAPRVIAELEPPPVVRPARVVLIPSRPAPSAVVVHIASRCPEGQVRRAPGTPCGDPADPPRLVLALGGHWLGLIDHRNAPEPESRLALGLGVALERFDVGYSFDGWFSESADAGTRFRGTTLLQVVHRFGPDWLVRPRLGFALGARIERDDGGVRAAGVVRGLAGLEFPFARDGARWQPSLYLDAGVEAAPFGHARLRGVDAFVATGLRLAIGVR